MLDYNVPGGKLNRVLSVVESHVLLVGGRELTNDEVFLPCALGWCIEWLQAYFMVLDDIMDNSVTRRGQPCWFRQPKVGMIAVNDGILLRNHISRITSEKSPTMWIFWICLMRLNSKLPQDNHHRIVQYKTAYHSFYLPVACALLITGENLDKHIDVKNILIDMGTYFQVQDDYLDCFGEPEVIGKVGTDIADFKCSWLVVKALELATEEQKKILYENYGKADEVCVARVKGLYRVLDLQSVYAEYESMSYLKLLQSIEAHPSKAVQASLKSFFAKIYKRNK